LGFKTKGVIYDKLISCLERKGISAFFQNQSQLVVPAAIPNFPTVNSFWVTQFRDQWKSKRRAGGHRAGFGKGSVRKQKVGFRNKIELLLAGSFVFNP